MKYIYLSMFLCLMLSSTLSDNTSFLKRVVTTNSTTDNNEPEPKSYNGYCFMKIKNNFYDLHPFDSMKPWKVKNNKGGQVLFNFCSDIDNNCGFDAMVADVKACKRFSGKHDEEKSWTLARDKNKRSILTVNYPHGESCGNGKFYQVAVELTCDPKATTPSIVNNGQFDETHCLNTVKMTSKYACSTGRFSAWWNQFGIPKQGLAAILIVIGLYFLIFGVWNWKTNSVLINCAILGLILFSFISLFAKVNLGLCMILGIGVAFIAFSFEAFNAVILGVVVGYLFGSLLYNLLVKVVHVNPQALYWSTLISCILFISIAGGFMKAYMVCLATSLVGAYSLVRGISIYGGGYPDETYVMLLINKGEYTQFGRVFGPKIYAYIGGIFALTGIGFWIQTYMVPANPENENKEGAKPNAEAGNANNNANTEANKPTAPAESQNAPGENHNAGAENPKQE